jgi:hypothetical protein
MNKSKKLILSLVLLLQGMIAAAQEKAAMADLMRSNGKIYVVVAVLVVILAGLFIYLFSIDRKIKNLEKNK